MYSMDMLIFSFASSVICRKKKKTEIDTRNLVYCFMRGQEQPCTQCWLDWANKTQPSKPLLSTGTKSSTANQECYTPRACEICKRRQRVVKSVTKLNKIQPPSQSFIPNLSLFSPTIVFMATQQSILNRFWSWHPWPISYHHCSFMNWSSNTCNPTNRRSTSLSVFKR